MPLFTMDSRSDLNKANMKGSIALLNAIEQNDIPSLNYLLKHKDVDLNCQNNYGETALMMSIKHKHENSTIIQLIEAGCDINVVDHMGRTALHEAIYQENVDITHELLKRSADIDARCFNGTTSLFLAITTENLEIFCMLLCYGADVTIRNENEETALTYAIMNNFKEMARLLIPYYDDFNHTDKCNLSPLYLAVQYDRILAFELLELGADVNGYRVFESIMIKNDFELFKKIWPKLDYQILLNPETPLLFTYLDSNWCFQRLEWLECFYLILECPIVLDLIQHLIDFNYYLYAEDSCFFHVLIKNLNKRRIPSNHVTNIIGICLSLGINVQLRDLSTAINVLGFQEDFEMLLYASGNFTGYDYIRCIAFNTFNFHPLLATIFGVADFNVTYNHSIEHIINCIGYFAIPYSTKQLLLNNYYHHLGHLEPSIAEKINRICEFPTLVELSRNQAHKFVRQKYEIKKPYHFQDVVKRLCLPQYVKDVIRFKKPIYQ